MLYDVTLTVSDKLPYFPGERGFEIHPMKTIEQDGANVSYIISNLHTGTHIDVPIHFVPDGTDTAEISLEKFFGRARVFTLDCDQSVEADDVCNLAFEPGDIVLLNVRKNNALQKCAEFRTDYAYVSSAAAQVLVDKGAKAVGINLFSIAQCTPTTAKTSHHVLLEKGVVIIEGLDLTDIPDGVYTIFCLPLKIAGGNGSPVRAVLFDQDTMIKMFGT